MSTAKRAQFPAKNALLTLKAGNAVIVARAGPIPLFPIFFIERYKKMINRTDYMEGRATFAEYYGEIVGNRRPFNAEFIKRVSAALASGDEHLNTIPLKEWDNHPVGVPSQPFKDRGDFLSPAGRVCYLKVAAKLQAEEATSHEI